MPEFSYELVLVLFVSVSTEFKFSLGQGLTTSDTGKSTITACPGTVQPVSQHLPGWRTWVMARAGLWGAAAALRR